MATEVERTIGAAGDHANVAIWEGVTDTDLVSSDTIEIGIMIDASHTDDRAIIAGGTVDATRYRILRASDAQYHGMQIGGGGVWASSTGTEHIVLTQDHFRLQGVEMTQGASQSTSDEIIRLEGENATTVYIQRCILHGMDTDNQDGLYDRRTTSHTINIENCLFWNCQQGGVTIDSASSITVTVNVKNCTFYDCGGNAGDGCLIGKAGTAGMTIIFNVTNTLAHAGTSGSCFVDAGEAGTVEFNGVNVIGSDATCDTKINGGVFENSSTGLLPSEAFGDGTASGVLFVSLTASSEDFHLKDHANNVAIDAGAFTTLDEGAIDAELDSRPGSGDWDCGWDETDYGAGPALTANQGWLWSHN